MPGELRPWLGNAAPGKRECIHVELVITHAGLLRDVGVGGGVPNAKAKVWVAYRPSFGIKVCCGG